MNTNMDSRNLARAPQPRPMLTFVTDKYRSGSSFGAIVANGNAHLIYEEELLPPGEYTIAPDAPRYRFGEHEPLNPSLTRILVRWINNHGDRENARLVANDLLADFGITAEMYSNFNKHMARNAKEVLKKAQESSKPAPDPLRDYQKK